MTALPPSAVWPQSRHLEQQSRSVPGSHLAALAALGLAFAAHASFAFFGGTTPVEQAGGNTALAAQGNSFANLAVGVQTPKPPVEAEQAQEVEKAAPARPLAPVEPQAPTAAEVAPVKALAYRAQTQHNTVQGGVPLLAAKSAKPVDPLVKPTLQVQEKVAPREAEPVKAASAQLQPPLPQPSLSQAAQPEPLKAQPPEPQSPQVERSLRPPERPQAPDLEPVLEPVRQAQRKPAPKAATKPTSKPQGNGEVNATRGVAQSSRQKSGGQAQNTAGQAKVQGSAAASNYAGLVMRRIQRANRRAAVKGVAMVRFSVTASGALAGVSIARSSGSGKLDGVALAQVRRAAPFPPPPAGARTTFTVRIKGN